MPTRHSLTPGRLYAMMSAEFQDARTAHCLGCIMPLLSFRERDLGDAPNWALEPLGKRCASCEASVARIFAKYGALYDVKDHSVSP